MCLPWFAVPLRPVTGFPRRTGGRPPPSVSSVYLRSTLQSVTAVPQQVGKARHLTGRAEPTRTARDLECGYRCWGPMAVTACGGARSWPRIHAATHSTPQPLDLGVHLRGPAEEEPDTAACSHNTYTHSAWRRTPHRIRLLLVIGGVVVVSWCGEPPSSVILGIGVRAASRPRRSKGSFGPCHHVGSHPIRGSAWSIFSLVQQSAAWS